MRRQPSTELLELLQHAAAAAAPLRPAPPPLTAAAALAAAAAPPQAVSGAVALPPPPGDGAGSAPAVPLPTGGAELPALVILLRDASLQLRLNGAALTEQQANPSPSPSPNPNPNPIPISNPNPNPNPNPGACALVWQRLPPRRAAARLPWTQPAAARRADRARPRAPLEIAARRAARRAPLGLRRGARRRRRRGGRGARAAAAGVCRWREPRRLGLARHRLAQPRTRGTSASRRVSE